MRGWRHPTLIHPSSWGTFGALPKTCVARSEQIITISFGCREFLTTIFCSHRPTRRSCACGQLSINTHWPVPTDRDEHLPHWE